MRAFLRRFFPTEQYPSTADRLRANFVYFVTAAVVLGVLLGSYLFPTLFNTERSLFVLIRDGKLLEVWWTYLFIVFGLVAYSLTYRGNLQIASWLLTLGLYAILYLTNLQTGFDEAIDIAIVCAIIVIGGLLLERNNFVMMSIIVVLTYAASSFIVHEKNFPIADVLSTASVYAIVVGLVYTFQRLNTASRLEGQSIEGAERFKLAEVNMRITRQASERESLDAALNSTLALILENYPQIYHAQIFLIDDDKVQARLTASTGDTGKRLIEKGHSLAVGSLSVIGQTTFKGEPVIAMAGLGETIHRENILLPETKLEAAFPLRVGGDIIGALDLQSKTLTVLAENDRLSFQSLANSLALAIDSIRQFEAAKARITENQRLAEQTRQALREVEKMNQRLVGRAWAEYVKGKGKSMGLTVDFEGNSLQNDMAWTDTLKGAIETNNVVREGNIVSVPLRVRGQVIGAMEFELDEDKEFSTEDLELIFEVSERFGLAAENTRLVEESQRIAQRESLINEITSRFQAAQNVEATLAEAARSLSETLQADKVMIRLGVPTDKEL
jgi:GAF domain-containing protein